VRSVVDSIVADYMASIKASPNVPRGVPDPYTPPKRNR